MARHSAEKIADRTTRTAVLDCFTGGAEDIDRLLRSAGAVKTSPPPDIEIPGGDAVRLRHFETDQGRESLWLALGGQVFGSARASLVQQIFGALRDHGVRVVVAGYFVSAINSVLDPGDAVLMHQILDRTRYVPSTVLKDAPEPLDPLLPREIRDQLAAPSEARPLGHTFYRGLCLATDWPGDETTAAVTAGAVEQADVVCRGVVPEAYLARSLGIGFGVIGLVVRYAPGAGWPDDWTRVGPLDPQIATGWLAASLVRAVSLIDR